MCVDSVVNIFTHTFLGKWETVVSYYDQIKVSAKYLLFQPLTDTFCSHIQAGAGWPGVSAVSNGGVVETAQGVNGTVLANQSSMGTAGYHTH